MNHCPSLEQLQQLLADTLPLAEAQAVEEHAAACLNCQQLLEHLAGLDVVPQRTSLTGPDAAFLHQLEAAPPWAQRADQSRTVSDGVAAAPEPLPDLQVAGYEVLGLLGTGGMGAVYKARHFQLNRLVALKVVLAGKHARPTDLMRFHIEAEAVAALAHANIVQVHEIGESSGYPYLALEYVDGGTLAQRLRQGPFAPDQAAEVVRVLATAMDYAHRRGVIHRDLKPANVLLTAEGQPKISDFGLAKRLSGELGQTATGEVFGTPSYMAPEQAQGRVREVSPATDVYALGGILYTLLTGQPPFEGATPLETLLQVTRQEPAAPSQLRGGVPRDLETICLKCLHKEPARRYASAEALADDLRRFLDGEPIQARPVRTWERAWKWVRRNPIVAGLAALLVAALLGGAGVATYFAVQAEARADQAEKASFRADQNARKLADEKRSALLHLYASRMSQAQRNWDDHRVGWLNELLDLEDPSLSGNPDLRGFEWYYFHRQGHTPLWTLRPGTGALNAVVYSPDGRLLAVAGVDRVIHLLDAETGRQLGELVGHKNQVMALAFDPDGKRLASLGESEALVWDVKEKKPVLSLPAEPGGGKGLAYSPNGRHLAIADGKSKLVKVYDSTTGRELRTLEASASPTAVAYSHDGLILAAALVGSTVESWELSTGVRRHRSQNTPNDGALAFHPSRRLLAVAESSPPFFPGTRFGVALYSVGGSEPGFLKFGPTLHAFAASTVAFHPQGKHVLSGGRDRTIVIWEFGDLRDGNLDQSPLVTWELCGHDLMVRGLAVRPGGRHFASVGGDGVVQVWDWETRQGPRRVHQEASLLASALILPGGHRYVVTSSDELSLTVRDRTKALAGPVLVTGLAPSRPLACTPDGKLLASIGRGRLEVWDLATGKSRHSLSLPEGVVSALALAPDGRSLAVGINHRGVEVLHVVDGKRVAVLPGSGLVTGLAFTPDGARLAITSQDRLDGMVRLWEPFDGREPQVLTQGRRAEGLALSADGRFLAAGVDRTAQVWELATTRPVRTFAGHGGDVRCLAFSPDGRRLVTGTVEGIIRLWDPETGQIMLTLPHGSPHILAVGFGEDGLSLLSCSQNGLVLEWDAHPRR